MPATSLHALLAGVIDYAGLFPPAKLPLEPAWQNFRAYQQSPQAWMLGRFVCPAEKLADLPATEDRTRLGRELTVLRTPEDLGANPGPVPQLDMFEMRLPADEARPFGAVVSGVLAQLVAETGERATTYLELPLAGDWPARLVTLTDALRGQHPVGLKLRTGGLEASAFPSAAQIAAVIVACRDAGIRWKATAGLHHPLRRYDAGVATKMHGFVNVLVADVLAHVQGLAAAELALILLDEDPGHFLFTADGLTWHGPAGDRSATVRQIATVRGKSLQSFGSCSFDEPVQDLRALGWLEP